MPAPPPCKRLGQQCQELTVTVRISDLQDDSATLQDASATWLTGHTERITWSEPYTNDEYLMVDATLHVPCRYLESNGVGARCSVHEFRGRRPTSTKTPERPNYQLGKEKFSLIQNGKAVAEITIRQQDQTRRSRHDGVRGHIRMRIPRSPRQCELHVARTRQTQRAYRETVTVQRVAGARGGRNRTSGLRLLLT